MRERERELRERASGERVEKMRESREGSESAEKERGLTVVEIEFQYFFSLMAELLRLG